MNEEYYSKSMNATNRQTGQMTAFFILVSHLITSPQTRFSQHFLIVVHSTIYTINQHSFRLVAHHNSVSTVIAHNIRTVLLQY